MKLQIHVLQDLFITLCSTDLTVSRKMKHESNRSIENQHTSLTNVLKLVNSILSTCVNAHMENDIMCQCKQLIITFY